MSASLTSLSSEEQEQLQQTIEMFEVIVQASPQDTQSLEILKDAYQKLGRSEAPTIARRLADTYKELGQFSQALLEYEAILQHDQNNMEVIAAIGEVEALLEKSGKPKVSTGGGAPAAGGGIKLDFSAAVVGAPGDLGTLMTTSQTQHANGAAAATGGVRPASEGGLDDSNEALAKFLVQTGWCQRRSWSRPRSGWRRRIRSASRGRSGFRSSMRFAGADRSRRRRS